MQMSYHTRKPFLMNLQILCGKNSSQLSCFSLIMEYAEDGDMYADIVQNQKDGRLPEEDWVWRMVIQMFRGLKALHNLKILHRDLKAANVFLTNNK